MASVSFDNTLKALDKFGSELKRRAKLNLAVRRKRKFVRSKWKDGRPTDSTIRSSYKAGKGKSELFKSIRYEVKRKSDSYNINLLSLPHWKYVEYGKKPFKERASVSPSGGPSTSTIAKWSARKNIQPRDLATNRFAKKTPENIATMNFLIARSIRWFGIEPLPFLQEAIDETLPVELPKLEKAISKDIANNIEKDKS